MELKSILNLDFVYMSGYTGLVSIFKDINPVVIFFGGFITILVGIANLIKFYHYIKDRKERKRRQKINDSPLPPFKPTFKG